MNASRLRLSLDGRDVRRGKHLVQRLHHVTHPHQSCGRRLGSRVLADLRRPATDVQTSASVARQCGHLREERTVSEQCCGWAQVRWRRENVPVVYLPGHQLESVLLEGLHLVQPRHDDLLQLFEAVRLERHPRQTLRTSTWTERQVSNIYFMSYKWTCVLSSAGVLLKLRDAIFKCLLNKVAARNYFPTTSRLVRAVNVQITAVIRSSGLEGWDACRIVSESLLTTVKKNEDVDGVCTSTTQNDISYRCYHHSSMTGSSLASCPL